MNIGKQVRASAAKRVLVAGLMSLCINILTIAFFISILEIEKLIPVTYVTLGFAIGLAVSILIIMRTPVQIE
jgi:hypothetical protein